MSVINSIPLIAAGDDGYQISRSVRLRSSASAFFNRTFASSGTDLKRWTLSFWMKRGRLGVQSIPFSSQDTPGTGASSLYFIIASNDTIGVFFPNTGATLSVGTSAVLRDPSAWYHIVFSWDSTQATSTDRIKIYINGVQQTLAAGGTYPSLNATTSWNSNCAHFISKNPVASSDYFDGYFTEINSIDGQALTPSSFGETNAVTGVWQPKKYAGTYGTNGFYLNFSDNSGATATTIGKDYSGNGNNWTPNNISVTAGATYDSMIDVPTLYADGGNGRGNYCVMNPLNPDTISLNGSLTNGNLNASGTTYGVSVFSCTFQVPQSGKWYWETVYTTITNTVIVGIRSYSTSSTDVRYYSNGNKEVGGSTTSYGSSWTTNDVIGVAVDRDAGTVTFYKNNTSQGSINIPTNSAQFDIAFNTISPFGSTAMSVNFGQRPFSYTPPSGFLALNTQNLPTPTISNGANYMAASTYTGNGATQSISNAVNGVSFQPDLVWVKSRSNAYHGALVDNVRGVDKYLYSSLTVAEETQTTALSSFNSNGFSLNGSFGNVNANAATYVGWQWKAGGTAVSNTAGSITSSVSVNQTAGFSVVTWTGTGSNATVGHGLGVAPSLIINKPRNAADNWISWHTSLGATGYIYLNLTNASATGATVWNSTLPTSSVFSVGTSSNVNTSGQTMVSYCWAAVAGYSAFGSYTGNGSADGPFVYCGFRPRFILLKSSSAANSWAMYDTSRSTSNTSTARLYANSSAAETTGLQIDVLSNGFKWREAGGQGNDSGATYIFAAFAENPFKISLAR